LNQDYAIVVTVKAAIINPGVLRVCHDTFDFVLLFVIILVTMKVAFIHRSKRSVQKRWRSKSQRRLL